jgi:carboxyl-terminal processing protease
MQFSRLSAAVVLCLFPVRATDLTPAQRQLNVDSFEYAWKTIDKRMWEPMPVDWQKVHDELRPKVEAARTMEQARAVMHDMIGRLKMTHFGIVPGDVYERLDASKGHGTGGDPGFDIRLVEGDATVVSVETGSPAYKSGIRPGWRIVKAGGADVKELIAKVRDALRESTVQDLLITRAVAAKFDGTPGGKVPAEFLDGANRAVKIDVELKEPRGGGASLGFLPTQHVWYESKRIGNAGYIRFNMFLDPGRISTQFGDSVQSCMSCEGLIIDLRGNPGGLGAMSMGMAGWLISRPDVRLGVMKTKETEIRFAVFPRPEVFQGPVAILVDALTASTSEIFAGGLKDLGRARIFGSRSAGAALPSMFEKLPNGDGFQYAIANYVSEGGQPLEGIGVIPDQEVRLTRQALLAGHDPALESALGWIHGQNSAKARKEEKTQ